MDSKFTLKNAELKNDLIKMGHWYFGDANSVDFLCSNIFIQVLSLIDFFFKGFRTWPLQHILIPWRMQTTDSRRSSSQQRKRKQRLYLHH